MGTIQQHRVNDKVEAYSSMQKDMLFYRSLETQDRSLLVFQQILFASSIAKARSAIFIE